MASAKGARLTAVIALCTGLACTTGCAELFKGPRVVTRTEESFYVRSIPILTSADTIGEIASAMCQQQHRQAVMTDSYHDVLFGPRYSTFACL